MISKYSVTVEGHKTSISLEPAFWHALTAIATRRGVAVNRLLAEIDRDRAGNLSSTVRLFVLDDLERRAAGQGDSR